MREIVCKSTPLILMCLWIISEISAETCDNTKSATFSQPNLANKATAIQNEIKKLKEDVEKLKKSNKLGVEEKARVTSLESTIEVMFKLIDNQYKEVTFALINLQKTNEKLVQEIEILNGVAEHVDKELVTQCIVDFSNNHIKSAASKLNLIKNENKIDYVIKQIYSSNTVNVILNLAGSIENGQKKFLVLRALINEIVSKNDYNNLIEVGSYVKNKALVLSEKAIVLKNITNSVETLLKNSLEDDIMHVGKPSKQMMDMFNKADTINKDVSSDAINKVIKSVYNKTTIDKILHYTESETYNRQLILYENMYDVIKANDRHMKSMLAFGVSLKSQRKYYETNPNYEKLRSKLPRSVYNSLFMYMVGIKSIYFDEYLALSTDNSTIYTHKWKPNFEDERDISRHIWTVENKGNKFSLVSKFLVYSGLSLVKNTHQHNVTTMNWLIVPYDDNCYIKTIDNFYLCPAKNPKTDLTMRSVDVELLSEEDERCLWRICHTLELLFL